MIALVAWTSLVFLSAVAGMQRNNEIAAVRNDEQSLARALEHAALPRHLTKRQQFVMGNFFRDFAHEKGFGPYDFSFRIADKDNEASDYAADMAQVLTRAGWKLSSVTPFTYSDDVQNGLSISWIGKSPKPGAGDDPLNMSPDYLFRVVLGLAGVRLYGSGTCPDTNVTEDHLAICVGHAIRDAYEVNPDFPF